MRLEGYAILAILISLLATLACSRGRELASRPSALILVDGAKKVRYVKSQLNDQLIYWLSISYPAESVLQQISAELIQKGWQPLREDWMNPGLASSHSRGWTSFGDATTKPKTYVFQWLAQWRDAKGNVVLYCFEYRDPAKAEDYRSTPDTSELKVIAAYYPMTQAREMMKWAAEAQKDKNTRR